MPGGSFTSTATGSVTNLSGNGGWLVWDGKRWARDATGQAARWMKSIAWRVSSDALAIEDEKERQAALNRARRGESPAGVAGALTLAGTEDEIVITPDDLDADPTCVQASGARMIPPISSPR
jgi:putative DNA primase/helicase